MSKNETTFAEAARRLRECKTQKEVEKRETINAALYYSGAITVREYSRLAGLEMEIITKIELDNE